MQRGLSPAVRTWRQIRARPRLLLSVTIGVAAFLALPTSLKQAARALIAWDLGAGLYLALAWIMMTRASIDRMKWRAGREDEGAAVVLCLTVAAAVASLAAIVIELSDLKGMPPARQGLHAALVAFTFAASWLLVHTSFALHYAHAYYLALGAGGSGPPLEFPRADAPGYMDFLYFSAVVGMTSQTADVAIAATRMRRLVMAHGMISFVFNTMLLALTVNIAASMLG